jgi:hypothetical protein
LRVRCSDSLDASELSGTIHLVSGCLIRIVAGFFSSKVIAK